MKNLLFLPLFFASSLLLAQVNDRTETDCNGNTASIYGVLGQGKALIVASKGLDCSICRNQAPSLQNWAANNTAKVEVWGAMTIAFSSQTPSCAAVQAWSNQYGWNDIFAFVDQNQFYFEFGTPRYLVYSPADSTVIYAGSSQSTARSMALNAALPGLSLSNPAFQKANWTWRQIGRTFEWQSLPPKAQMVSVQNLAGQVVQRQVVGQSLNLQTLPAGIYLMSLSSADGQLTSRKILLK